MINPAKNLKNPLAGHKHGNPVSGDIAKVGNVIMKKAHLGKNNNLRSPIK